MAGWGDDGWMGRVSDGVAVWMDGGCGWVSVDGWMDGGWADGGVDGMDGWCG